MQPKFKRRRLLVDPSFQFQLLLRVGSHLLLWSVVAFHVHFLFYIFESLTQGGMQQQITGLYVKFISSERPLLGTLILVAPIFFYDLLKFSNRVAGPLYRCRKVMQAMAAGKTVPEFKARKHDLLADFFRDFNLLIKECNARAGAARNGHAHVQDAEKPLAEEPQAVKG